MSEQGLGAQPFWKAQEADLRHLQAYGALGHVPAQPLIPPGGGRFGNYVFDRRALLQRSGLTVDERRELIFLSNHFRQLDHFEFFGIEATDDRRALKGAYFELSKRYHPDALRGKDLGVFTDLVAAVYQHASQLNDLFQQDEGFRGAYARVVQARNAFYREQLEVQRQVRDNQRHQSKLALAEERKRAIEARLARNQQLRNRGEGSLTPQLRQAERFYTDALAALEAGNKRDALNLLRLVLNSIPNHKQAKPLFEQIDSEVRQQRAKQHWAHGQVEEELERLDAALAAYQSSIRFFPDPARILHTVGLVKEMGRKFDVAIKLLTLAGQTDPMNIEVWISFADLYGRLRQAEEARLYWQKAAQINARHPEVVRAKEDAKF